MANKILILGVALMMCLGLFAFSGCTKSYTEAEHIRRITERVQSRFLADSSEYAELYTEFSVELLYNAKDKPSYFMVEFEPDGFLYGIIDKGEYYYADGFFSTSLIIGETQYHEYNGSFFRGSNWKQLGQGWYAPEEFSQSSRWYSPLAISPSIHQEGNFYFQSHYKVAEKNAEKKYMFFSFNIKNHRLEVIHPLIKNNDAYVCVVSGQEYESTWFNKVSKNKLTTSQKNKLTQL